MCYEKLSETYSTYDVQSGIKGSILADFLHKHNISLVWIDLR